jgi:hypothetical protein
MRCAMIDFFALAVSHGLIALAAWRLMLRTDLDRDPADEAGEAQTAPKPMAVRRA